MNTATTLSIVLRHIIPALQSIQRDILDAEREVASRKVPEPPKAEPAPKETSDSKMRLLKPLEAAEFLGMRKLSFYRLVSGKKIPHYRIGSRILISQEQLQIWLASNESVSG
jgi:excisionase family DNA binding protein